MAKVRARPLYPYPALWESSFEGQAHRLRVSRIALGLSQDQAAAALGRSSSTWRKYETAERRIPDEVLIAFCIRYELSLDWLVRGLPTQRRKFDSPIAILARQ